MNIAIGLAAMLVPSLALAYPPAPAFPYCSVSTGGGAMGVGLVFLAGAFSATVAYVRRRNGK